MSRLLRSFACCLITIVGVAFYANSALSIENFGEEDFVSKPKVVKAKVADKGQTSRSRAGTKKTAEKKKPYRSLKRSVSKRKAYRKRRIQVSETRKLKYRVSDRRSSQKVKDNRRYRRYRDETSKNSLRERNVAKRSVKRRYVKKHNVRKVYKKKRFTKRYARKNLKVTRKAKVYKKRSAQKTRVRKVYKKTSITRKYVKKQSKGALGEKVTAKRYMKKSFKKTYKVAKPKNFKRRSTPKVKGRSRYSTLIAKHASKYGVPVNLAHAIVRIESNYRAGVRGGAGEIGLMQIKPATARMMGFRGTTKALYNPDTNIKYGMKYLAGAYKRSGGTICGTVLKYNAGHGAKRMNPISARYCRKAKRILGNKI